MAPGEPGDPPPLIESLSQRARDTLLSLKNKNINYVELDYLVEEISNIEKEAIASSNNAVELDCIKFAEALKKEIADVKKDNLKSVKYSKTDKGPFLVIVESINKNIGNLNPFSVGKLLYSNNEENDLDIMKIVRKGRKQVGLYFHNFYSANDFVDFNILNDENYMVFIPARMVSTMGIVRDIGLDISEDDIMSFGKGLNPKCKILRTRRLNRRIVENEVTKYVPSTTCIITFEGNTLPKEIVIFNVLNPVEIYISPVIQCMNCLRFGHVKKNCRGNFRCIRCGKSHDEGTCEVCCLFCGEDHPATYRGCKEFVRQKKIKEIMAYYNLSFFEATKSCDNDSPPSPSDFPGLSVQNVVDVPNGIGQGVSSQGGRSNQSHIQGLRASSSVSYSAALKNSSSNNSKGSNGQRFSVSRKPRRRTINSPGFDSQKHEECFVPFNPSYSKKSYNQRRDDNSSGGECSSPKKIITLADMHRSNSPPTNKLEIVVLEDIPLVPPSNPAQMSSESSGSYSQTQMDQDDEQSSY